jgi:pimeloyl-ACP methyl ester carboxylesterase
VLLHGGLTTIEISFGRVLPELAAHHRVIAVELQGHGRTAGTDQPMTFQQLAVDVVGLLDHLAIEQADVFGFSRRDADPRAARAPPGSGPSSRRRLG